MSVRRLHPEPGHRRRHRALRGRAPRRASPRPERRRSSTAASGRARRRIRQDDGRDRRLQLPRRRPQPFERTLQGEASTTLVSDIPGRRSSQVTAGGRRHASGPAPRSACSPRARAPRASSGRESSTSFDRARSAARGGLEPEHPIQHRERRHPTQPAPPASACRPRPPTRSSSRTPSGGRTQEQIVDPRGNPTRLVATINVPRDVRRLTHERDGSRQTTQGDGPRRPTSRKSTLFWDPREGADQASVSIHTSRRPAEDGDDRARARSSWPSSRRPSSRSAPSAPASPARRASSGGAPMTSMLGLSGGLARQGRSSWRSGGAGPGDDADDGQADSSQADEAAQRRRSSIGIPPTLERRRGHRRRGRRQRLPARRASRSTRDQLRSAERSSSRSSKLIQREPGARRRHARALGGGGGVGPHGPSRTPDKLPTEPRGARLAHEGRHPAAGRRPRRGVDCCSSSSTPTEVELVTRQLASLGHRARRSCSPRSSRSSTTSSWPADSPTRATSTTPRSCCRTRWSPGVADRVLLPDPDAGSEVALQRSSSAPRARACSPSSRTSTRRPSRSSSATCPTTRPRRSSSGLPMQKQIEVIKRIANMEQTNPEVIREVEKAVSRADSPTCSSSRWRRPAAFRRWRRS